jgi:hypothetical protein
MANGPWWCKLCALPKPLAQVLCLLCGGWATADSRPDVDEDRRNHLFMQESLRKSRC